ncbi:MAG: isopeptide-forming domain-containing fimbrial protein [Clostridia bacterium]
MKNKSSKILTASILSIAMMSSIFSSTALADDSWSATKGDGKFSITIINESDTGISIDENWFHAYQILEADSLTSYSVHADFIDFFKGSMTGGDGNTYDFETALESIADAKADVDATLGDSPTDDKKEEAYTNDSTVQNEIADYSQLVSQYIQSFNNDLYDLAIALREYIQIDGDNEGLIECIAHAQASKLENGDESVTLEGLTEGYYFVLNEESTLHGLGIAASGAFVPVGNDIDSPHPTIYVKTSVPTVDKDILHNDLDGTVTVLGDNLNGQWDTVGDYQIGDNAYFRVTSTLPNNIKDYNFDDDGNDNSYTDYFYVLTDTMSSGLSYNEDVKIYTDRDATQELDKVYYNVISSNSNGFKIQVNVKALMNDDLTITALYTQYSALITSNAVVSSNFETNEIELEFSNNPNDSVHTGTDDDIVYSYTFDLEITKMDESGNGLAGATFGIYDGSEWLPVKWIKTVNGVDYYSVTSKDELGKDGGYIVTRDNDGVVGQFVIYGLDDQVTYMIKEEFAPEGYNTIDPFTFVIDATYNSTTGKLSTLTDNSSYISNSSDLSGFEADIINRKTVILPATGGIGTVIFQVLGGSLMLSAAAFLVISSKKKHHKES